MSDDKKPRATLDAKAQHVNEKKPPKLEGPASLSAGSGPKPDTAQRRGPEAPAGQKPPKPPTSTESAPRRVGILSVVLAGLVGGVVTAGAGYLALSQGLLTAAPSAPGDLRRIEERVSDLDRRLRLDRAGPSPSQGAGVSQSEINELRARLDGMVQAARDIDGYTRALSARLESLESPRSSEGITAAVASEMARQLSPLSARLAALEQRLDTVHQQQSERQAEAKSAALTLALGNLNRAILEGRPFSGELSAVANLAGGRVSLESLAAYKDTGVPSLGSLQKEFSTVSQRAIEKTYKSASGTFVGEVFSRAKAAIQIKPADSSGESVEAVLGRMGTALKNGNLKGVLDEAAALPAPAQEETRAFLAKVAARDAAEDALKKAEQDLYAALTRSGRRP